MITFYVTQCDPHSNKYPLDRTAFFGGYVCCADGCALSLLSVISFGRWNKLAIEINALIQGPTTEDDVLTAVRFDSLTHLKGGEVDATHGVDVCTVLTVFPSGAGLWLRWLGLSQLALR